MNLTQKQKKSVQVIITGSKICVNLTRFNTALPKEMYRFDPLIAVA